MTPPSPEKPKIEGKNWMTEVKRWNAAPETRNEFYKEAAKRRLELQTDIELDNISKDLVARGLKTAEDIKKAPKEYLVKEGQTRLYEIIDRYFKEELDVTDAKIRQQELGLTLYYLTKQGVNVDHLVPSWKVKIKDGKLTITTSTKKDVVTGKDLREVPSARTAESFVSAPRAGIDETATSVAPNEDPGYTSVQPPEETGYTPINPPPGYTENN